MSFFRRSKRERERERDGGGAGAAAAAAAPRYHGPLVLRTEQPQPSFRPPFPSMPSIPPVFRFLLHVSKTDPATWQNSTLNPQFDSNTLFHFPGVYFYLVTNHNIATVTRDILDRMNAGMLFRDGDGGGDGDGDYPFWVSTFALDLLKQRNWHANMWIPDLEEPMHEGSIHEHYTFFPWQLPTLLATEHTTAESAAEDEDDITTVAFEIVFHDAVPVDPFMRHVFKYDGPEEAGEEEEAGADAGEEEDVEDTESTDADAGAGAGDGDGDGEGGDGNGDGNGEVGDEIVLTAMRADLSAIPRLQLQTARALRALNTALPRYCWPSMFDDHETTNPAFVEAMAETCGVNWRATEATRTTNRSREYAAAFLTLARGVNEDRRRQNFTPLHVQSSTEVDNKGMEECAAHPPFIANKFDVHCNTFVCPLCTEQRHAQCRTILAQDAYIYHARVLTPRARLLFASIRGAFCGEHQQPAHIIDFSCMRTLCPLCVAIDRRHRECVLFYPPDADANIADTERSRTVLKWHLR